MENTATVELPCLILVFALIADLESRHEEAGAAGLDFTLVDSRK